MERAAREAGLPKPKVYVVDTPMPNAFATGRNPQNAAVAATTGIMGLLTEREISGVFAHELGHVKNRDTLINTVVAMLASAVMIIAMFAKWSLFFGLMFGGGQRGGGGSDHLANVAGTLVLAIVAPIVASMIQMAVSRTREYGADETGARNCRDPEALASALQKLALGSQHPQVQAAAKAMVGAESANHLFIVNPLAGGPGRWFASHPAGRGARGAAARHRPRHRPDLLARGRRPVRVAPTTAGAILPRKLEGSAHATGPSATGRRMSWDIDASTTHNLRDKYAIVGVGETTYTRGSGMTTRALGTWAVRNAIEDAGLTTNDVDGMLSYSGADSTPGPLLAADLGIRLNFYMDCMGGGSSTEALVGLAMGAIEVGLCHTVVIFRSMNGFSQVRIGGTGRRARGALSGDRLHAGPYGWFSAGQSFAPVFMRHMYEYGTTPRQVAHVKMAHSRHASQNPKAYYKHRVSVDDVLDSRWICKPLHLLDCCVETDNATAIIVTSVERAYDMRHTPARILGVVGRCSKPGNDGHMSYQRGRLTTIGADYAAPRLWSSAGVGPEDVDVSASYDAFTFTALLQLEAYGFCAKGEGGAYVSSGDIQLGGKRPNNTSGGHLCEGYTHGMNMVIENVRQLRGRIDDYCPLDESRSDGARQHSYDYETPGACRQVRDVNITANLGWATPATGSALVMRKG